MSILEDLDLMDLLDVLPAESDFELDDILSEFSTPGLFAASESPAIVAEEPAIPEIVEEPTSENDDGIQPEECFPDPVDVPVTETAVDLVPAEEDEVKEEEEVPEIIIEQDETTLLLNEVSAYESDDREASYDSSVLFGDALSVCDILYEFGTPTDEEGVKLYTPASPSVPVSEQDEDDVKIFVPETRIETADAAANDNTVLFDAAALNDTAEPAHTADSTPIPAKAPGFFAKAAAAVMGLFASKKSAEKTAPAAQQKESLPETDYLALFTQDDSEVDVQLDFAPEVSEEAVIVEADQPDAVEEVISVSEEDAVANEIIADFEEVIPTIESEVSREESENGAEDVFSADSEEPSVDLDDVLFELSLSEENPEDAEDEFPVFEPEAQDEACVVSETEKMIDELPVADTVCFDAVELPATADMEAAEPSESTILFESVDLDLSADSAAEESAPALEQPKEPGFFAKAAAAVMGLFTSKKPATKAAAADQGMDSAAQEAPFASLSELFTEESTDELSSMDELMLELEMQMDQDATAMPDDITVEEAAFTTPAEEILEEEIPVFDITAATEDAEEVFDFVEAVDEPAEAAEQICEASVDNPLENDFAAEELPADYIAEEPAEEEVSLNDILFELSLSETEEEEEIPVFQAEAQDEQEAVSEAPISDNEIPDIMLAETMQFDAITSVADEPAETPASTMLFDAMDLDISPAAAAERSVPVLEQPKAPGFLAKAAAVVMGLFASKKAAKKTVSSAQTDRASISDDDPFANLADLFAQQETDEFSGMDELMLELEMQVEREAELEAEAAARDAAERLAREEEQRALELEAQRLAQEEADAEAAHARMLAAEEARMKAESDALLKQQQAPAEEELFDRIESSEKRRQTAVAEDLTDTASEASVVIDFPATENTPVASNTPVYDYAAVDLSEPADAYAAPQMDIQIDEEVPEEVGDLLEMPDVEQISAENAETPEEAAARKKKEDDALHYKPEESTAKTITTHIGNRFGAAFAAFANSDDDSDREEDLGPELPANKAYRFFNKYISGYRFRLRISAAMCVILGWISLGLPVLGSLKNPAVSAAMCLMMLLTVMLAGADILATGVRTLINRRPGIHSLVAVSCFASVIDALVIIFTKGTAGYLPFCAVSAISMCFAIYGSLLYCRSQRLNFKTLDRALEPMTISVDYGIVEEDTSTVYRTPGHPEGYIHHSEEEDLSEALYGMLAPIILPVVPVMTLIAALFSNGFGDFFHIMAAMFGAAASFSALIAFPLPYFLVQRDLYATKAAIAGWAGTREIGRVANMIVTDRDLFPEDTVSIKSVRIVDNVPPQLTLSYMCSVVHHSDSCLVPAFNQLAENNDCELLEVENFQCHEAGGLSAEIGPDSVLVASHSYMKLQGFRIPARKKDSENALFLAVNGHVIAYIIVDYKPMKSVRAGLQSALRGNVEMIFAARDFNVTPLLIAKKFKSATETLRFPSYSQRYEITQQSDSETATCAAVVYRKSFYSYAVVVEKARNLYKSVSLAVILSVVSSIMGILLMFFMAITGAGAAVTVSRLLIFMLLWLIPTLALAVSMTK